MEAKIRYVKPGGLRVPPERNDGADPMKLQDQFNEYGIDMSGMPFLEVLEGKDGLLVVYDGVTRATRSHFIDADALVPVLVTSVYPDWDLSRHPTIEKTMTPDF